MVLFSNVFKVIPSFSTFAPRVGLERGKICKGSSLWIMNWGHLTKKSGLQQWYFTGKCLLCSLCSAGCELNSLVFMSKSLALQGKKGNQTYIKETFTFNELVIIGRGCFLTIRILLGSLLLWTDKPRGQIQNLWAALIDANGNCMCSWG